jgi:hypothetical protein
MYICIHTHADRLLSKSRVMPIECPSSFGLVCKQKKLNRSRLGKCHACFFAAGQANHAPHTTQHTDTGSRDVRRIFAPTAAPRPFHQLPTQLGNLLLTTRRLCPYEIHACSKAILLGSSLCVHISFPGLLDRRTAIMMSDPAWPDS